MKLNALSRTNPKLKRKGAVAVEFAMASIVFFLFLFGIVEYARFLFMYNLLENATREAARFAVVNTNLEPTPPETPTSVVQDRLEGYLVGVRDAYENLNIQVNAIVGQPGPGESAGDLRPAWTDARTTDIIRVQATAIFRPILPNFLLMGNTINLNCVSAMYSEAN